MLLKKKEFPEENELVMATVTKINPNSVFLKLDNYQGKSGLMHISEISPGRIRNISDYVGEGRKVVCKVISVDKSKGHIDLSLRRVTEIQKREKVDQEKQEKKAEKLLGNFAEKNEISQDSFNKDIIEPISENYEYLHDFFDEVVDKTIDASEVIKNKSIAQKLQDYVRDKIKPPEVEIKGKLELKLFTEDGVKKINKILKEITDDSTYIHYLGAGTYSLSVRDKEYKSAESKLNEKVKKAEQLGEKEKGIASFQREQ